MRKRGRIDANQPGIVKELRRLGCSVLITSDLGRGAPDIAVGLRNQNYLFEIKDPSKPPSARELTYEEQLWHQTWSGQIDTVTTIDECLAILNLVPRS